jgi:hypothetical protein
MTTELPSRERTDADIAYEPGYPEVLFEEAAGADGDAGWPAAPS